MRQVIFPQFSHKLEMKLIKMRASKKAPASIKLYLNFYEKKIIPNYFLTYNLVLLLF